MLETLDYTIRIGSIPTFLYFEYTGVWLFVLDIKMLFSIKNKHFGIAKCWNLVYMPGIWLKNLVIWI